MHDNRLKRCPFCDGACKTIQGEASAQVWPHGKFWRVFCTACQCRQLFHRTEAKAINAWNRRAPVGCGDRLDLENDSISVTQRVPRPTEADENGLLWWKRSGVWCVGHWKDNPVDATRWAPKMKGQPS